jgi:hypothetical protein
MQPLAADVSFMHGVSKSVDTGLAAWKNRSALDTCVSILTVA